jgi:hypothetical protein
MAVKKVTFTLPRDLVRRIKKLPAGKRSRFVTKAIEKELDRQARVEVLRKAMKLSSLRS